MTVSNSKTSCEFITVPDVVKNSLDFLSHEEAFKARETCRIFF